MNINSKKTRVRVQKGEIHCILSSSTSQLDFAPIVTSYRKIPSPLGRLRYEKSYLSVVYLSWSINTHFGARSKNCKE